MSENRKLTVINMKKDAMLHIRTSSEIVERVKTEAERLGLTQSEFCLNAILSALGENLEPPAMENVLARLKALEDTVKKQAA